MRSSRDAAILGRLSRALAARPGRRARTSGGRPHLWRSRTDDAALAAAGPRDRHRRVQAPPGASSPHWGSGGPGAAEPGGRPPRRHPGRTRCALGRRAGHPAQFIDDVAGVGAARGAAHKTSLIATERDEVARQAWRDDIATIDPARLLFLDETATPTTLTRLRARAPRGERAVAAAPGRRGQNVTVLASISATGMGPAMVLNGALARESCDAYVEQILLPTLVPGQIVVWDRLPVHTSARARALIEGVGCEVRVLPSYSPDVNPIELAFAKIKQVLRGTAERTFAGIVSATAPALDTVTAADARGFFAHCGYPLPA